MRKLVLVRHGQSLWNLENKFTGWVDVDLSEKGIAEAKDAGQKLLKSGFDFKTAFVSKLTRANQKAWSYSNIQQRYTTSNRSS